MDVSADGPVVLKSLYPKQFQEKLAKLSPADRSAFCKVNGNEEMLQIIQNEKYIGWRLASFGEKERKAFLEKRKKYLLY